MELPFRRLSPHASLPTYQTEGSLGFDIAILESVTLQPQERARCRTGLCVAVPKGYGLFLFSRSSGGKRGIILANSVGVIDSDYCGPNDEILLMLYNISQESLTIQAGERVAQGVLLPVAQARIIEPESWEANRDRGGFGSTGLL